MLQIIIIITSCGQNYVPKPKGYPRIALPEKKYQKFDTSYPYSFEYPKYSYILPDKDAIAEPYWINLIFPGFDGQVHISYKRVHENLQKLTEDTRKFAMKHIPKASSINDSLYTDPERDVHGIIYNIHGAGAASTYQFYLTDSSKHFLRGALYFNMIPNNDSLAPVIEFIKQDIDHIMNTLKWKSNY